MRRIKADAGARKEEALVVEVDPAPVLDVEEVAPEPVEEVELAEDEPVVEVKPEVVAPATIRMS